ncbi:MAG: glycoside hydrolase family 2 TIM barrel-domain containing protein [Bacteroidota bacterium]
MRAFLRTIVLALVAVVGVSCEYTSSHQHASVATYQLFNRDWYFATTENSESTLVQIPHIPRIEPLVVNDQWQGKHVYLKQFQHDTAEQNKTFLHFEGVMHESIISVNGTEIKKNKGGYLPFSVDLSGYLRQGVNEIKVTVSNEDNPVIPPGKPLEGLDFNYYGGIYRDVWLIRKNDIYVTDPFIEDSNEAGWLIHFDHVSEDSATGFISLEIANDSDKSASIDIEIDLSLVDKLYVFSQNIEVGARKKEIIRIPLLIDTPMLWSRTNPYLYDLRLEVSSEGEIYDRLQKKVGVRKIELSDEGFFLNGKKQFLRGTNRHQEYPYVGYAISNNANYRDALKIKNAGFDFVRLSHYPHDEAFLNACDELGILVMNAIPGWQHYQDGEFEINSFQDIRDMVRRDRNHPSVVFWEVSLNESEMTESYMEQANAILREELPFDDTYSAGWIDHPSYDLYIPARQHSSPPHYWNQHGEGKRNIFIAEYGDWEYYAHNAGFNQTAFADLSEEERNSRQLRAHGEHRLLQQAMNFQEAANSNRRGKGTIGHANWLMFDYNRGYADDLEASGISDIFRLPKFSYYFYKSQRPPTEDINHPLVEDGPMLKIACYWKQDSPIDIRVFSNCDAVSLYLNDSLIATEAPTTNEFSDRLLHPPFQFELSKFEKGELKAIGFIDGKEVVFDRVTTPGKPEKLTIRIDTAGGFFPEENDLFFVYAQVMDSNGEVVPTANGRVRFYQEGKGQFIGENPVRIEAGIATLLFQGDLGKSTIRAAFESPISMN